MEQKNDTPDMPIACIAGCGFYGNPIYNNMCSKCFKEKTQSSEKKDTPILPTQQKAVSTPSPVKQPPPSEDSSLKAENPPTLPPSEQAKPSEISDQDEPHDDTPPKPVQENKGRCFKCRVKVPLAKQTINKCKCDYVFCDTHRYPDRHECSFDHVKNDKDILAKNNPKVNERPKGGRSFQRIDSL
ncbi:hypothetical protein NQZ79_g2839 [Umbelopsis isabellina]|nr:hypothetical protein NQZ79_g2839 [Umbelopsis isabellina]